MTTILHAMVTPFGKYGWSAVPEAEIVDLAGVRINGLRVVNDGETPALCEIVRDGEGNLQVKGTDGLRWAYRDRGNIVGDMTAWNEFEDEPWPQRPIIEW